MTKFETKMLKIFKKKQHKITLQDVDKETLKAIMTQALQNPDQEMKQFFSGLLKEAITIEQTCSEEADITEGEVSTSQQDEQLSEGLHDLSSEHQYLTEEEDSTLQQEDVQDEVKDIPQGKVPRVFSWRNLEGRRRQLKTSQDNKNTNITADINLTEVSAPKDDVHKEEHTNKKTSKKLRLPSMRKKGKTTCDVLQSATAQLSTKKEVSVELLQSMLKEVEEIDCLDIPMPDIHNTVQEDVEEIKAMSLKNDQVVATNELLEDNPPFNSSVKHLLFAMPQLVKKQEVKKKDDYTEVEAFVQRYYDNLTWFDHFMKCLCHCPYHQL